jgi:hypothetical protein
MAYRARATPRGGRLMKGYPKPGTRIYARGCGKHALGTVSQPASLTLDEFKRRGLVTYHCDWNKGQHLVKLADIRLVKPKTYKPGHRDSDQEDNAAHLEKESA